MRPAPSRGAARPPLAVARGGGAPPAVLAELERDGCASARASLRWLELHRDLLAGWPRRIDAVVLEGLPLAQTVYGSVPARGGRPRPARRSPASPAPPPLERVGLRRHRGISGSTPRPRRCSPRRCASPRSSTSASRATACRPSCTGADRAPGLPLIDERWIAEPAVVETGGVAIGARARRRLAPRTRARRRARLGRPRVAGRRPRSYAATRSRRPGRAHGVPRDGLARRVAGGSSSPRRCWASTCPTTRVPGRAASGRGRDRARAAARSPREQP